MRIRDFASVLVIVLLTSMATPVAAQIVRAQHPGMFGGRTFGQPLTPRTSAVGSGLIRGPSGNFQAISPASSMFVTPWRPTIPVWPTYTQPLLTVGAGTSLTLGPGSAVEGIPMIPAPATSLVPSETPPIPVAPVEGAPGPIQAPAAPVEPLPAPAAPGEPSAVPPTWFRSNGSEMNGLGDTAAAGLSPRVSLPPRPKYVLAGYGGTDTNVAGQPGVVPPIYSAPLSAHLTSTARFGGVGTPTGIYVYFQNDTAILRGTVATLRDRDLVGNLALLEPGVWRIDNQLAVAAATQSVGRPAR